MTVTFRDPPSGPLVPLTSSTDDVENDSSVSGSSTSIALDTLDARLRVIESYEVLETFQGGIDTLTGANQVGGLGDHSWSFFGTGATRNFGRPNNSLTKYGRYSVGGGTSTFTGFMLGSSTTPAPGIGLLSTQIESVEWSAACNTSSGLNGKYRFGVGTNVTLTSMGTNGIFFEGDEFISNNWRCIARKAGVNTTFATTTSWKPNGTYFKLGLFRLTNGDFRFDVNDVTVATLLASAMPVTRMLVACQCESTINSGQGIEFDTCRLRYRRV